MAIQAIIPLLLAAGGMGAVKHLGNKRHEAEQDAEYTDAQTKSVRSMLEYHAKQKDAAAIMALEASAKKYNIPIDPYVGAAKALSDKEKAERAFWGMMQGSMQPKPQAIPQIPQGTSTSTEMEELNIAPTVPTAQPAAPTVSDHRLKRMMFKEFGGIDIGPPREDPETNAAWFKDFKAATVDPNVPVSQAIIDIASKYGFIPEGASNLDGLSDTERDALFMREFHGKLNDQEFMSKMPALAQGTDPKKAEMFYVLDSMMAKGGYAPKALAPFTEAQRAFEASETSPEIKQVLESWGVDPATADSTTVRMAELENDQRQRQKTKLDQIQSKRTEFALEEEKPVSSENRAKFGIRSGIKTYKQLVDEGFRFPTNEEQKIYMELSATREEFKKFKDMLFGSAKHPEDGIFTGVGDDWISRGRARGALIGHAARGTKRGQNLQKYEDLLASFARRLLTLAGESGGRFTDVDVKQIMRSAPDAGALMDGGKVAKDKFERFIFNLNYRMDSASKGTTLELRGQGGGAKPTHRINPDTGKLEQIR